MTALVVMLPSIFLFWRFLCKNRNMFFPFGDANLCWLQLWLHARSFCLIVGTRIHSEFVLGALMLTILMLARGTCIKYFLELLALLKIHLNRGIWSGWHVQNRVLWTSVLQRLSHKPCEQNFARS